MKPDICSFCRGKLVEGHTEFVAHVKESVIVIEDVPAWICEQCGEPYFSSETSQKIDVIMKQVHSGDFVAKPIAAGRISLSNV